VKAKSKDPSIGGKGWQKPCNLMYSSDPRLQRHLQQGGNYGIVAGFGLAILNVDHDEVKSLILEKFPKTFMWESPGHKAPVALFHSNLDDKMLLQTTSGEFAGEILWEGFMAVGPGSIHPNGGVYRIINDAPIATVPKEQLTGLLGNYLYPEKQVAQAEESAKRERKDSGIDLNILQVVPLDGLKRQGDEYYGPHPVHGSPTTGHNFWVNPTKNVWHCFRHKIGGGPLLWLAVKEGLIKCEEATPGVLRGDLFKKTLEKAVERGLIKEYPAAKQEEAEPIILGHLNMIEDPDLAGRPIIVEAVVSSTSTAYLSPTVVEGTYEDKDGAPVKLKKEFSERDPDNIKFVGVNEDTKYRRLRRLFGVDKDVWVAEKAWRTIYKIRVRPPVFTLEKRGEKIVDEKGYEYKAFDIYITASKPVTFQPSTLIRLEGIALPNPRTQSTTLLAHRVEFPEEMRLFDVEKLKRLKTKFEGLTVKQRLIWILDNFEKFAQIIGRRNLAEGCLLGFFTPLWIHFNGETQKGWGCIILCGDTTTAKSETVRKLVLLLKAGALITAESASTVGLTGTATQVEKEGWFVDWGFLVLLDRQLLAVDGAHKLSQSNWAALAEAERSGVVSIAKAAKNTAYARTRQIKIANPVDREAGDKYTTKSLASFLYPCQSLPTILDKTSIARLDLAVFADRRDVKPDEINVEFQGDYDKDLHILSETLKWAWSGVAEVKFTKDAVQALLTESTNLYNTFFSEAIPLASIDMKWKLARLSTALAYMTLSTGDFNTVTVTKEHVDAIVEFIQEEYSKAGLNTLAQADKFETLTPEDVDTIINKIITETGGALDKETIEDVFKFIILQGRVTRDQLLTRFGLSENNELRPLLATLTNENLVKAGRGLYPTPKLIQVYKLILSRLSSLTTSEKNPQNLGEPLGEPPKNGGFSLDIDNHDNLDKKHGETPDKVGGSSPSYDNHVNHVKKEGATQPPPPEAMVTCFICLKPLYPGEAYTFFTGRQAHVECYNEARRALE
jgi:hypothetical protein